MARPVVAILQLDAADTDNVALAQALAGAGLLTINGAAAVSGVATLDSPRRIGITSSGNDLGITFVVTGTDYAGSVISETVTGAYAGVSSTSQDFATVTSVRGSGAAAANVSVGTTAVGSTPWHIPNAHITPFSVAASVEILSGAANVTVECTDESPWPPLPIYQAGYSQTPPVPTPFGWPGLTGVAANSWGDINRVCAGIRLTINAGTGTVQAIFRQAGISN